MAVWKPNLGHCTGRESTFLTWCQSLHIFDQKITESLAIRLGPKVLLSTPLGIFWNKLGIFKSEPTVHTNFGKYQKILLEMEYFETVLRKILRKFNIIFYSNCCEKQKGPGTSYHPPFSGCQICSEILFILWSTIWLFLVL